MNKAIVFNIKHSMLRVWQPWSAVVHKTNTLHARREQFFRLQKMKVYNQWKFSVQAHRFYLFHLKSSCMYVWKRKAYYKSLSKKYSRHRVQKLSSKIFRLWKEIIIIKDTGSELYRRRMVDICRRALTRWHWLYDAYERSCLLYKHHEHLRSQHLFLAWRRCVTARFERLKSLVRPHSCQSQLLLLTMTVSLCLCRN